MTKSELAAAVAAKSGLTNKATAAVLNTAMSVICETLMREEKVQLIGFGTFYVAQRKARKGVNPSTKAVINIPAAKVVRFKPSKKGGK